MNTKTVGTASNSKTVIAIRVIIEAAIVYLFLSLSDSGVIRLISESGYQLSEQLIIDVANTVVPYSFGRWVEYLILLFILAKYPHSSGTVSEKCYSLLFSCFLVAGWLMDQVCSVSIPLRNPLSFILSLLYFVTCFCSLRIFIGYLKQIFVVIKKKATIAFAEKLCNGKLFIKSFSLIFIFWLPWAVLRYPAGVESDAYVQIMQYLGYYTFSNNNPPASTAFIGLFVKLGHELFGSYNIGAFAFVIVQMLFCAAVFAYTLTVMKKLKVNTSFIAFSLIAYSFVPVFFGYSTSIIKDAHFSAAVVLLLSAAADIIFSEQSNRSRYSIALLITGAILTLLFRNTGILFVLTLALCVIVMSFRNPQKYRAPALCLAGAVVIGVVYSSLFLPLVGVKIIKNSQKEYLSIPIQQTACCCSRYGDELNAEEIAVINSVLDFDIISTEYNPYLSDTAKATWHGTSGDILPYLSLYAKQLIKYPGCYLDAFLGLNYGFYYPSVKQNSGVNSGMYRTVWGDDEVALFTIPDALTGIRGLLMGIVMILENSPVFYPFCSPALYFWLILVLIVYCAKLSDKRYIVIVIPMLVWCIGCLACPTFIQNGVRYALPYMWSTFLVSGIVLFPDENNTSLSQ